MIIKLKEYYNKHIEHLNTCMMLEDFHCFYNTESYMFTSYKVASSSFRQASFKNKIQRVYELDSNKSIYGLVRCPYKRIESFYKDKILKGPDRLNSFKREKLQYCQSKVINLFDNEKFLGKEISFENFVCVALEKLALQDNHLLPQSYYIPKFVQKIFKLDDCLPNFIVKDFHVNYFYNTTKNIKFEYTKEMKEIVKQVYKTDYNRFF